MNNISTLTSKNTSIRTLVAPHRSVGQGILNKRLSQKRYFSEVKKPMSTASSQGTKPTIPTKPKTSTVILPSSFETSKMKYEEPKKNALGSIFVPLSYDSEAGFPKTLKIQTPTVRVPWGIVKTQFSTLDKQNENPPEPRPRLIISLEDADTNDAMKKFSDFLGRFDEKMLAFALKEKANWFKSSKPLTPDILKYNYKASIRPPKDSERFAPTMSLKIPTFSDGKVSVDVYGVDHELVPLEYIKSNAKVTAIVEPRSIYFIQGSWGVTWNALQIRVDDPGVDSPSKMAQLTEYAFLD